jgi:murein DD-endopeptidase MepM/ murein hydrolase activator NlpD
MKPKILLLLTIAFLVAPFSAPQAKAQLSAVRTIVFPVIGSVTYYDDFGNARSGGRTHEGNDLMGRKMLPLVAAVDGTIVNVNYPEEDWGYAVTIRDKDGYTYHYIHMNNDTPGTDDGAGDGFNAYAPEVMEGNKVVKGQLIGYMGDSGNAETTPAHLHFEIREPDRQAYSPYRSLQNATKITVPTR